jgi:flagellar protein FliL
MPEAKIKEKIDEPESKVETTEEAPKKSGGLLKLIIILAVMQVAIAAGSFILIKTTIQPKAAAARLEKAKEKVIQTVEKTPVEIFLIDNILVNPAGTNGTRYLSTSIGLEIAKSEKNAERIKELTPVIRDILIAILSSKTLDDLSSKEGKEIIRKEILDRLNEASVPDVITRIYFVDYVLQ